MTAIFGDIKKQLQGVLKIKDVNSDNVVFKLFYKATFAILIGAAGNFWNISCTLWEEANKKMSEWWQPRVPQIENSPFSTYTALKAMKSSYLLGPFCDLKFWRFSLLKIKTCRLDVAKFRFVNSRQLWINAELSIVTNLNFATSCHPTSLNFLQGEYLQSRKAWEGNLIS